MKSRALPAPAAFPALSAAALFWAVVFCAQPPGASTAARAAAGANGAAAALEKFSAAWGSVTTYTCTITAHEVSGSDVQDRVYDLFFRKPHDTRMNVTGGDGRGSAVVWDGSDRVYGHKGGMLAMFKKHLSLHDPQATSIRGTTVAEANFGAILDHVHSLVGATLTLTAKGTEAWIDVAVSNPAADQNVTRERIALGSNDLPVEYDQWEGDAQVKKVTYSNVKINVPLPDSTFSL